MDESPIQPARPEDAAALSRIALESKAHWGYDEAFMALCRDELTITHADIARHPTFVLRDGAAIVGFYLLVSGENGAIELDFLYLLPAAIGRGHGRRLFEHAVRTARAGGYRAMRIQADPNAAEFYRRMGAAPAGSSPSGSIPGRELPLFRFDLRSAHAGDVTILSYPTDRLPPAWHWQVLSFLRITWPEGFTGPLRQRTWITRPDDHPLSFLMVEDSLLLAHVNVVWKRLAHAGEEFKAYGLTGVFAYPPARGQGYGLDLVRHATAYIDSQDADVALFNCAPAVVPFYRRAGWEPLPDARTWIGPPDAPERCDEVLMMRFISARGRRCRPQFERGDLYFGSDSTW